MRKPKGEGSDWQDWVPTTPGDIDTGAETLHRLMTAGVVIDNFTHKMGKLYTLRFDLSRNLVADNHQTFQEIFDNVQGRMTLRQEGH